MTKFNKLNGPSTVLFDVIAESNSAKDTVEDGTAANDDHLNDDDFEPDPQIIEGLIQETKEMLRSGNTSTSSDNGSERGRGRGRRRFKKT